MEGPRFAARNSLAKSVTILISVHVMEDPSHARIICNWYRGPVIFLILPVAVSSYTTNHYNHTSRNISSLPCITPGHPGLHSDVSVGFKCMWSDISVAQLAFSPACSSKQETRLLSLIVAGKMHGLLLTAMHSEVSTIISRIPTPFSFVWKITCLFFSVFLQLKR